MSRVVYVERLQKLSKALCDDKARETVVIDFYSIVSSTLLIAIAFRMRIPNLSHSRHDSLCRSKCLGLKGREGTLKRAHAHIRMAHD